MSAQPAPASDDRSRTGDDHQRFLDSLAEVIRTHGPQSATVAAVVREARASRRTFYAVFENLEDCLLQLVRRENTRVLTAVASAIDPHAAWTEQIDQALTAWGTAASAALEIRLPRSSGPAGARLQKAVLEEYVQLLISISENPGMIAGGVRPVHRHEAIILMGGIRELYRYAVEQGVPMEEVVASARGFMTTALRPTDV
ncbi:TetR/AcrR family transcriptional regulator [Brevibacterium album]|uniref:TetR/AcrR family transcriptional regulator n=1 Tax=Brevibacterium album TaxID=417948 RepID=UPI0003F4DDE9|nr:TetR/AcrR family transcriptional regulator [Brevibacterium album]